MSVSRIKKVIIVGGGTSGWMTASALSKVYGKALDITLIESDDIGIIGVGEATIPSIALFNSLLQIDENDFLRKTKGSIKLGIQFVNWFKEGHAYMHAFGQVGRDLGPVAFHNYWLEANQAGVAGDFWDYSVNYQAAKAARFAPMGKMPRTPLADMPYAYHFDAGLYAAYLREYSEKLGVKRVEGFITGVNLNAETGYIRSVVLKNGPEIDGELFIDCSGFRGLLIEEHMKTGYVPFSHWLKSDGAWAVPCEGVPEITPYTRSTAFEGGWQWRIPLQHRIGNGVVFASDYCDEQKAVDHLMANLDGKPLADPRLFKFSTGHRKSIFNKNCLAIGLSSGFLEPLESTAIHLIQSGIGRLISLFPNLDFAPSLMKEFNRQSIEEYEFIRDFIILHYYANEKTGQAYWDDCRHMDIPDSLKAKLELFTESAILINSATDLFKLPSWVQVLLGQGVMPKQYHGFVLSVNETERREYLDNIRFIVKDTVSQMSSHTQFLAGLGS